MKRRLADLAIWLVFLVLPWALALYGCYQLIGALSHD